MSEGERELDRWLAEHVMGFPEMRISVDGEVMVRIPAVGANWRVWSGSGDILDAWMVVGRLLADGWDITLGAGPGQEPECELCPLEHDGHKPAGRAAIARAPTFPLAICRAAKEAVAG